MNVTQTPVERKQRLLREVDRYVRLLTEYGDPELIILFGSLAGAETHEWSDIDLVIVADTDLPFWDRLKRVRKLLKPTVAVDILWYTPEEFERLRQERSFVQEAIVNEGTVLYERGT